MAVGLLLLKKKKEEEGRHWPKQTTGSAAVVVFVPSTHDAVKGRKRKATDKKEEGVSMDLGCDADAPQPPPGGKKPPTPRTTPTPGESKDMVDAKKSRKPTF